MNVLIFTGNLGQDAEVKYLPSGSAVCEFSVAMKSGYGDREKTNWVRCKMFGKKAEGGLPQYLKVGQQVVVKGELELEEWEDKNGKGAALSLMVEDVDLIGSSSGSQQSEPSNSAPKPQQSAPAPKGKFADVIAQYWALKTDEDREASWALLSNDEQKAIIDSSK